MEPGSFGRILADWFVENPQAGNDIKLEAGMIPGLERIEDLEAAVHANYLRGYLANVERSILAIFARVTADGREVYHWPTEPQS